LTAVRRCWESAKGRSEPRNTVGRQAKCPLATQRSPLCFSPGCESARGISFASSRCPLAAAAFSPPERPASSSISMLARCSSSFSIERSLAFPKRHRDAMIESAGKAGIKVGPEFRREFPVPVLETARPYITTARRCRDMPIGLHDQPSSAADFPMDCVDNRSPKWRRTRPLRVRVCDIDEPLRECSAGMRVYPPVLLSR
jgi:hypothetical protein